MEIREKYNPLTKQESFELEFVDEYLEQFPPDANIERTGRSLYAILIEEYVTSGMSIRLNFEELNSILQDNFKQINGF